MSRELCWGIAQPTKEGVKKQIGMALRNTERSNFKIVKTNFYDLGVRYTWRQENTTGRIIAIGSRLFKTPHGADRDIERVRVAYRYVQQYGIVLAGRRRR